IDESHPQFAGMYSGALSTEETRKIVEGAELVLDIGGVSLNDETTMGFSTLLDPARFISIGLNDVRVGEQLFGNVRLADTLAAIAKLKSVALRYKRKPFSSPEKVLTKLPLTRSETWAGTVLIPSSSVSTTMAIWWSGRWSQIQIGPTTTWQNGVTQSCRTLSDAPIGSLRASRRW